ncbi:HNH endonuclease [Paenibacillus sp. SYP-B4298]|uniref:HNH endonuclease n=1 Tax=Paenibacillus sp. SYP-B4298 TaxID=2996034 RepID=UPI003FA7B1A7
MMRKPTTGEPGAGHKICIACGQAKPIPHFLRRSGGKRRGTCRDCRRLNSIEASLQSVHVEPPLSRGDEAAPSEQSSERLSVSSLEQGGTAVSEPQRKRKRKRKRRSKRATPSDKAKPQQPLATRSVRRAGQHSQALPPLAEHKEADASGLRPTRGGFIRMRGKTDNGRSWYQEIELELAVILVRERAAVMVNPHTIRRIYANKEFRRLILERDAYTCYFCGQYGDTIDHLVPRAKGGHTTPLNIVCACNECNQSKADQDLDVFTSKNE